MSSQSQSPSSDTALNARILIAGAGGLGSPVAMILARYGIRHLGIADYDKVELSNLHRQILHSTSSLGQPKTVSGRNTLNRFFPDVNVELHSETLTAGNIMDIVKQYDLVIDAVDNFPARYLLNDACYFAGIPLIDGGVAQFHGQVTMFKRDQGPCLRCIFPEPPPPGLVPTCQQAGVLGPVAGIIGSVQAWETIKYISGSGEPLIGKIWIFDTLNMKTRIVHWPRYIRCALCGDSPAITEPEDIEYPCETG